MFTVAWLKDTFERVTATFAEAFIPTLVGADVFNVDWKAGLGISLSAAGISLLKSIVATQVGDKEDASLVK